MIEESEWVVMRYLEDGEYSYLEYWEDSYEHSRFCDAASLNQSTNLIGYDHEKMIQILEDAQEYHDEVDVELVRIKQTLDISDLIEEDDTVKEIRQKRALSKLTPSEIRALGLTKIAVYIKTKYHNA